MLAALAAQARVRYSSFPDAVGAYLRIAAQLSGVRSAFISRLDSQVMEVLGTWDDGGCGIPLNGVVPLEETFCQYVRAGSEVVVVEDAANDPRVANVATRTDFSIGAYLGVPLLRDDGSVMGSFCLLDPEPRSFSADEVNMLVVLAELAEGLVERELAERAAARLERDTSADLIAALGALDERGLVLQTVAHDLRTPLSGVLFNTDMLLEGTLGPLNPDQAGAVARVRASARFMNRLVTDLVDMCQVDQGSLVIGSQAYHPADLVEQVRELSAGQASECGLSVAVERAAAPPSVIGDPARVQQILLNLVSNALHHTAHGTITLRVAAYDSQIEYSVRDSGPGITPDVLPQIWQRGWRGSKHGAGLGLYLVRRLAEAMGGSATAESSPGEGSTFFVRLPLTIDRPVRITLS
jgi:signal transduction histidine kinase